MSGLTPPQYYTLVVADISSSCISILGSSIIIHVAAPKSRERLYHRLLLLLSLSDIAFSFTNILHPFLLPQGTPGLLWSRGSVKTCSAMGFCIVVFPLVTSMFNAFLSLSFTMTIRYNWSESKLHRYEAPCYALALLLPLTIGAAGLLLEAYNPSRLAHICYFNDYPQDCADDPDVDCIRGEKGDVIGWVGIGCLMLAALVGFAGTLSVYCTVRSRTKAANRRSVAARGRRLSGAMRREQTVAVQAVLYSVVYLNSFVWPFLVFAVNEVVGDVRGREGDPGLFALQLFAWMLFPLQGFMNCLVYLHPQWKRWRMVNPKLGRLRTIWHVTNGECPHNFRVREAVDREAAARVQEDEITPEDENEEEDDDTRQPSSRRMFDGSWFFIPFRMSRISFQRQHQLKGFGNGLNGLENNDGKVEPTDEDAGSEIEAQQRKTDMESDV